jgi:hypothetical protein
MAFSGTKNESIVNKLICNNLNVGGYTSLNTLTVSGSSTIDTLTVSGASTLDTLDVSGSSTLDTLTVSGSSTLDTLDVSGSSTLDTLDVSGSSTLDTLNVSSKLTVSGNTFFNGGVFNNTPLIIGDPGSLHILSIYDSGRNIFIFNTGNITDIQLPLSSDIIDGSQSIFSFIIMNTSRTVNIRKNPIDNNIVGVVMNKGVSEYINGDMIVCSAGLLPGANLNISNLPISSGPSWFIFSGGICNTTNGYTNLGSGGAGPISGGGGDTISI